MIAYSKTGWACFVSGFLTILESVMNQIVLSSRQETIGILQPFNIRSHIFVLVEDTKRDIGPSDVPDIDREITNQPRTTGQVIIVTWSPFDLANWSDGKKKILHFSLFSVPNFNLFVPASRS